MRHALLAALVLACALPAHADTSPVDDARLLRADADHADWLTYGRDYANRRFSPLAQINRGNVGRLAPAWTFHSGVKATFEASPIVVDGVMYVSLPFDHVVALDAATGREIWRYRHDRHTKRMCCGPANRGVAVAYGKVFIGTVDARLIALDQRTGRPVWDIPLVDDLHGTTEHKDQLGANDPLRQSTVAGSTGVGANMAPLVYRGKVVIGITGVGYGLHLDSDRPGAPLGAVVGIAGQSQRAGFYAAFDAETGKRLWQFDSTPKSGWAGDFRATTPGGEALHRDLANERANLNKYPDAAREGGGSAWTTPAFDPDTNTLFVGIGNPSPQMDDETRPGDNLYTVSLVALDADTGALKWYCQFVPHDLWGYDVASPPVLLDVPTREGMVPAVGHAGKTGWWYVVDRRTGRLLYKSPDLVPHSNMFARPTEQGVDIAPGGAGGVSWSPLALDPRTGLAYIAALHWPMRYTVTEIPATDDKPAVRYTKLEPAGGPRWGVLSAVDTRAEGRIVWQVRTPEPLMGGVLATAGNLIFTGEGDGSFRAYDAASGKVLWTHRTEAGANAPPVTYEVDGRQYVAVAAGGNQLFGFTRGDAIEVFALPE
ncbi:MAG: PQQ-binding-like beta-propeller repeat protein [Betaproteobacteria bacterium]|nr:PQQ-binding-like beta-propeller repeat protein [Betaproteobacteria bacterium]